ncbi:MAG: Coenzyme F420 hydrogenase/dehydrogenase, beta subunit C-terminal domain [Rikenellaceae bacterium]
MKHIDSLNQKERCSGCTACVYSCPKQCISIVEDNEGFSYPRVDASLCIDCGLCVKVCPFTKDDYKCSHTQLAEPIVYAAKHKKDSVRLNSTSGGIFTSLSDYILTKNGVVCGAIFNPVTQRVEHTIARSVEERDMMRGSKYVQSYLGDIFPTVKSFVEDNIEVLFTGAPCQTSGLLAFLRKDYPNLYVVDILCHSVPSPVIAKDMINSYTLNATNIIFRDKSLGWRSSYGVKVIDDNGTYADNHFLKLFWKGVICRPSCDKCNYTNTRRPSDITIGDYWGIHRVDSSFEDTLGVSSILINSKKGEALFAAIQNQMETLRTTLSDSLQDCLCRRAKSSYRRDSFWRDYQNKGYSYVADRYSKDTLFEIIKRDILAPVKKFLIKKLK